MSFNNGLERKKFNLIQKKHYYDYLSAGMTEDAVNALYKFDLAVFNSNRRYCEHTQPLLFTETDFGEADDGKSPLCLKFERTLSVRDNNSNYHSRYWWRQEIENPVLSKKLNMISKSDLELLTLIAFDGYTQKEVAKMKGVNQSVISRKIKRIKKILSDVI